MTVLNASDRFVSVNGLTLPIAVVQLALDLEARGLHLAIDGDDLLVSPRGRLTDQDRADIRRWKQHLRAIVAWDRAQPQ